MWKDGGLLYNSEERADLLFTYTERNDGTQYSQRDSVETRVALADALMTAAETNREKKLVEEYKRKADEVGKINEKLQQTRRELTEARRNNAPKDEITKLQNRAKVYADQVNREDSRLLKLGAMAPVRDVISRVKADEHANATVKRQEAVENARAKGKTAVADARAAEQLKAEARLERQKARDAESKAVKLLSVEALLLGVIF